MKRFARGNRFPAEERAIYHKSLARDSPFPRLKGGVTPDHLFGKGECRLSLDLAKRKSICPCAFQRRKKKTKKFRLPNISIRKIGDDLNERTEWKKLRLDTSIYIFEETSYGNEKRREGKR